MASRPLPFSVYRDKVLAGWLGKAVGGTLGGPFEGQPGPLSLAYYDPVPDRMLPNDDLDLQIVWLEAIRRRGLPVDRRVLADAWLEHVHVWPAEYGVACRNMALGLYPPVSGHFDNGFRAGMGAAIRTEIWACLAPGDPELARALAREDACVDHAGDGVYAALYLATVESAAFVESDRESLLDAAQKAIPAECRVARAVADTRRWWAESGDWMKVRERILAEHGRQDWTDVAQNLAFIVLGWLDGGDDFGRAICTAVNCGLDTDCTGATLGAILGIRDPTCIEKKWLEPIGRGLVLSANMVGMHHAATLDELTDQVAALAAQVLEYYGSAVTLRGVAPLDSARANMAPPRLARPETVALSPEAEPTESLVAIEPLVVRVTYPPDVAFAPRRTDAVRVRVSNPTGGGLRARLTARVPDGWCGDPSEFDLHLDAGGEQVFTVDITPPAADAVRTYFNPLDLRFQSEGLGWTATAGLVTTIPWRRWAVDEIGEDCPDIPQDAERIEAPGHFEPIPDGAHAFAAEFKLPHGFTRHYVVQARREVWVWIDGELLNHHLGQRTVPAIHLAGETGKELFLGRGWHRVTVVAGEGRGGELFFAYGDRNTWDWIRDVEWRPPAC